MPPEIDEAWAEEAIARYRRIQTLRDEFDRAARATRVTVRSSDGLVEVVVTAAGEVTEVRVVGSLHGLGNRDLSVALTSTIAAAADAARWARDKLRAETFFDYPPLGER
jgi:DNA-binding protein YbaB